jgi:TetR/AcrR family transcriptional regulator, mexJK operon transcriptional repressor
LSTSVSKKGRPADPAKREAIVAAAVRAFFEHGFASASIEQIAADAGVSKVTIYNLFGNKRGLFTASIETVCGQMRNHFSIDENLRGTLRSRLLGIGEAMVAFLSRPEMVQFERRIAAETVNEPEIGATFLAAGPHRMKQALAEFLRAMHEAGELEIQDFMLAAEQFASMCRGMGDLERRFGQPNDRARDRARIEGAVEVFCRAYAIGNTAT